MAWYKTGTVAVAATKVTGTGTNFLDAKFGIGPGQAFLIPGSGTVKIYEIASVEDATHLTLTTSAGTVAAGAAYAVMSFYTDSVPDFSKRLAAQLGYYQSQMDGWQQIMTGTGTIAIVAPDNTVVNISSFSKLTSDIAKAYTDGGLLNATVTPNSLGNVTDFNIYYQTANVNAIIANGYPIAKAGTLYVTKSAYGCQQRYETFQGEIFVRGLTGTFNAASPNWSEWWPVYTSKNTPALPGLTGVLPVTKGGTGATTYPQALYNIGAYPAAGGTISGNVSVTGTFIMVTSSSGFSSMSFRHPGSQDKIMAQMFTENYGDIVFQTSVATNQPLYYFSMRQNGNFTVPGNITCTSLTQTSDATKKKKVEPIKNALSKINKIDGVTFLWKENSMPSAGVIAQQLMEVLPESVSSVFDDNNEYGEAEVEETDQETGEKKTVKVRELIRKRDDSLRTYSVEYSGVIALAVEAIKELSTRVSELEAYIGLEKLAEFKNASSKTE